MVRAYRDNTTAERVRELFDYNPETGALINRTTRKGGVGSVAGYQRPDGYWMVCIDYGRYLVHRIGWLHHYGEWPAKHLDHIDQNPSNNAIANLRECDDAENAQNLHWRGYGTSGYLGVTADTRYPGRWIAKIKKNQKAHNLGSYACRTSAYVAYCTDKKQMHTFVAQDAGGYHQ